MFGPSGFFQNMSDTGSPVSSADLEIIHDSEDGFNILYRAQKNGRFFVYKALKPEYRGNQMYEELLKKDFNIGFTLTHAGICQYYGMVYLPSVGNCIVMEWIDGCSLEELIRGGRIDRRLAKKIICELCDSLEYIHRKQVIHRDLKPENILVTYNGQNVKLIDFGLSDADSYNVFKAPAGTKVYASPELLAGEPIDSRSDIWSLGMIIGEMTGCYHRVAAVCLRRSRERRFKTVSDVRKAVLAEGRRKLLMTLFYVIMTVLISFSLWVVYSRQPDIDPKPMEEVVPCEMEDTMHKDEKSASPETEPVLQTFEPEIPVKDSTELMDEAALDDLFKEVSGKL